jgi:hypothetical protein
MKFQLIDVELGVGFMGNEGENKGVDGKEVFSFPF